MLYVMYSCCYDHKVFLLYIDHLNFLCQYHTQYAMSVNSTIVLILFVIVVPTLNKVLS